MKLLTKALLKQLPPLYSQEKVSDPVAYIKFFCPWNQWTWYATEGSQEGEDFIFFGLVKGFETELGYFSLNELEQIKGPLLLKIERDYYFNPTPLSQLK